MLQAPPLPTETRFASEGIVPRRLVAWAIDFAILSVLGVSAFGPPAELALPWLVLLALAYGTLTIASPLSATPGQAVCGLVVRSDSDDGHPTPAQAFTASLLYTLSWATAGLAFLAPLFSTRGRTLHDLFSGTVVMHGASLRGAPAPVPN